MGLWLRIQRGSAALGASIVLAACGGGIYLGFDDDDDNLPPVVQLVASSPSVWVGDPVLLSAAAADENGIRHVIFFRYDGNTLVRLGADDRYPYEWEMIAPADGRTSVLVFARAVDYAGNWADSTLVSIAISP